MKMSIASLRQCMREPRNVRPAQTCIIVGPVNCGKTFLFEQVIAPVLGGRVVDAFKAFSANAEGFNGELLNGELWKRDDRHGSTRADLRRTFASNIKSYLFSGNVSFHSKGRTPVTLNPFGRLFIFANDEDKDLLVLPDTTPDMADKLHILRCNPAEPPMPTDAEIERVAYCATVTAKLPHLIADLDVLTFQADRQRVIESFRQADNRYFLQHCLQEILKRRLKVEVATLESQTPELVPVPT
jgi:hypothetical protein